MIYTELLLYSYRRQQAVNYANYWAYRRNPAYYNYDTLGGDCTNFASQCIFAGTGVMNDTPIFGWYYIDGNQKAPAWTGVEYLHNFLLRKEITRGPIATVTQDLSQAAPGDVIQLRFQGDIFQHSPVVLTSDYSGNASRILLAAHSSDSDCRPLDTYNFEAYRVLHILGYYAEK